MAVSFSTNGDFSFVEKCSRNSNMNFATLSYKVKENLNNGHMRTFVYESCDVFNRIQSRCNENSMEISAQLSTLELLSFSREYCSILRSFCERLEKDAECDSVLLESYKCTELIWTLAELLFMQPSGGSIALDLVKWATWNFTSADTLSKDALSNLQMSVLDANFGQEYWDAVYLYVLYGRHSHALDMMALHPRKGDEAHRSVNELIKKIPLAKLATDPIEFKIWQDECRRRLGDGHYKAHPQLTIIVKILCGEKEVYSTCEHLFGSWYESIVPLALYGHTNCKLVQLADVAEEALQMFPAISNEQLRPLDAVLISLLDLDVLQSVSHMTRFSGDFWLPAHLAHLLHLSGCVELGQGETMVNSFTLDQCSRYGSIRDYLVLEYAQFIMKDLSMFRVCAPYFLGCGDCGRQMLQNYLSKMPVKEDKKALLILNECRKYGMDDVGREICRVKTLDALREGRLANALAWCFKANDASLATTVAEKCLDLQDCLPQMYKGMGVLENLSDNALLSPLLIFLSKHREFTNLNESGKKREAAGLLVDLVTSQLAPRKLWVPLLNNVLDILAEDEVYFGTASTFCLLEIVETMMSEATELKSKIFTTTMHKHQFDTFVKTLRAALLHNLTRNVK